MGITITTRCPRRANGVAQRKTICRCTNGSTRSKGNHGGLPAPRAAPPCAGHIRAGADLGAAITISTGRVCRSG